MEKKPSVFHFDILSTQIQSKGFSFEIVKINSFIHVWCMVILFEWGYMYVLAHSLCALCVPPLARFAMMASICNRNDKHQLASECLVWNFTNKKNKFNETPNSIFCQIFSLRIAKILIILITICIILTFVFLTVFRLMLLESETARPLLQQ